MKPAYFTNKMRAGQGLFNQTAQRYYHKLSFMQVAAKRADASNLRAFQRLQINSQDEVKDSIFKRNIIRNKLALQNSMLFNSVAHRSFATETIKVPGMGDSITEGTIEEFVKGAGEVVEADELVARIETDKVTVDITSPKAGVIKEYLAAEGDTVDVGQDFFVLEVGATAGSSEPAPAKKETAPTPPPVVETPKVVETKTQAPPPPPPKRTAPPPPPPPKKAPAPTGSTGGKTTAKKAPTTLTGTRTETHVPMNRMRKKIAQNLKDS